MKHKHLVVLLCFLGVSFFAHAQQEVTLEQVITLALEKNYDVRIVRAVSQGAEVDREYSWGAFLPQLSATGAATRSSNDQVLRSRNPQSNEIQTREGPIASQNITGSVDLNWTLFDGTRMFATRERIDAIAEQSQLLLKDQMVNTVASVITFYYDVVRQKQQLRAIQEQMSVSEERVKLAERKLQVGTGIKPELLQARVDFNAQRSQVIQQESTIEQLKAQLNNLVGMQLPAVFDVADTILINLDLQPEEISQNIETSNFALQAARENVRISNLALRERRAEYLPFLSFNASYSYTKTDNTKLLNPFGLFFNRTHGYNYGLGVNIPLVNAFNTRRLNQQARIEVDRQTLLFDQLKSNVNVGLQNAYVNYENAKKILSIEEENIGLAKENVFIALEGFKRGVTTFIELRTAQQSLADAYNSLISARFNAKIAETELLRLSGKLIR